jgi:ribose 5-phosphate isomerase RpiB
MIIAVGADHAGYALNEQLAEALRQAGHEVIDDGTHSTESTDYPPYAPAAAEYVKLFLETPFDGGRHQRRVDEITKLERT